MADIFEEVNIQWHPGFYGAAELVEEATQMSEPGDRNNEMYCGAGNGGTENSGS